GTSVENWVGFGDASDNYSFSAEAGTLTNVKVAYTGTDQGDLQIEIRDVKTSKVVKKLTLNNSSRSISSGELALDGNYTVVVTAKNAAKGGNSDYTISVEKREMYSLKDKNANDTFESATSISFAEDAYVTEKITNEVYNNAAGADVDYYKVIVKEDGSYSLDLTGINGKEVKVSLGIDNGGKFKSLQSVTGKNGADSLTLSCELAADTYYIKVESNGKNSKSAYDMTLTRNNSRVDDNNHSLFNNSDDTWKQVSTSDDVPLFDTEHSIEDWVGFGDVTDVFKINLADEEFDDNHVVTFEGKDAETVSALKSKAITLALVDENGKSVALTFDSNTGNYTSKITLMADTEYYLTVKNAKAKDTNIAYNIGIVEL
ncbi:MAG: hypothetical protein J6S19_05435, partial [Lentisphaeria bacterium]|nr:hypothetical protein [Lentisphaeria bacterium]